MHQSINQTTGGFQSGMTLFDYIRSAQFPEENPPTADTHQTSSEIEELEDNLYKTANVAPSQPHQKLLTFSIKEIEQENFEDSLDQLRDSVNVNSTQFQKIAKQQFKHMEIPALELKKKQHSNSNSPYNHQLSVGNHGEYSPRKTFTKTFYGYEKSEERNKSLGNRAKINPNTLYGNKFLSKELHNEKGNKKTESERQKNNFRKKTKQTYTINSSKVTKNVLGMKGLDLVVEGFKDKLYSKKK